MPEKQNNAPNEAKAEKQGGNLSSPEGILMLSIAALLDLIGFIFFLLAWLGIDDFGILDIIGGIIIGGWLLLRGGNKAEAAKKALRRFLTAEAVELIPFLGGISPSWVWLVYKVLNDK